MINDMNRINQFYEIKVNKNNHKNITIKKLSNDKERIVPLYDRYIYLDLDYFESNPKVETEEEFDKLAEENKIIKLYVPNLFQAYFGWSDEELKERVVKSTYGYDERTLNYLNSIKENLNFVEEKNGWDEERFIESKKYNSLFAGISSQLEIGLIEDGKWCAQYSFQTAPDDYNIRRLYFSKRPTSRDVKKIITLRDLELEFRFDGLNPIFNCYECGREVHWLDFPGGLTEKIDALKDGICSVCEN